MILAWHKDDGKLDGLSSGSLILETHVAKFTY